MKIISKNLFSLSMVFLLCCLTYTNARAQINPNLPRNYSAQDQLLLLKHSALLVRLPDYSNKMQALKQAGLTQEAKELKVTWQLERKEIILAFRQTYDFGNVYFFEAENYPLVQTGNLNGILINLDEKKVPEAALPNEYLIGAFGETEKQNISAFVVMDKNFNQLKSPFPYYQRTTYFLSLLDYSKAEVIERWNQEVTEKYKKWFSEGIWRF